MICGIDEAGRGPLAGPVTAAAVILPDDFPFDMLNDSKKMSEKKRQAAASYIMSHVPFWAIGWASAAEIDNVNILQATFIAMERAFCDVTRITGAVADLSVIVDGTMVPPLKAAADMAFSVRAEAKADGTYPAVMAASILAKTARDRMMVRYSWLYPEYGYEKHKGYPTKAHVDAIRLYGLSPIQRTSFTVPFDRH